MTEARTSWTLTPVEQPDAAPITGSAPTASIPTPRLKNQYQVGPFIFTPRVVDKDFGMAEVLDFEVDMLPLGGPGIGLPLGSAWDLLVKDDLRTAAARIVATPDRVVTVEAPNPITGQSCHFAWVLNDLLENP